MPYFQKRKFAFAASKSNSPQFTSNIAMQDVLNTTPILQDNLQKSFKTCRYRLAFSTYMLVIAFLAICYRLVDVTVINPTTEHYIASAVQKKPAHHQGRANIVDRNNVILATNLKTVSLSANPQKIENPEKLAQALARILTDQPVDKIRKSLNIDKHFVWLAHKVTPKQQYRINKIGNPQLAFHKRPTRVYPHDALVSHALGYANIDNLGIAGIEKTQNSRLEDNPENLTTAIDIRIQHVMREELAKAIDEFKAIGGTGIVMDVNSGELISMVSLPDFNPNHPDNFDPETLFNRATLGTYELGSTFKIFNTAAALEQGVASIDSRFDATKPLRIARFAIRDYHAKNRWLSLPEIFIYSSNIGSARMAVAMGGETQRAFMDKLGMLRRLNLELPELGTPQYPARWREINTMTIAFGHGISITPVHLASAVATIVNGGIRYAPSLLKKEKTQENAANPNSGTPNSGIRVISAQTSEYMRKLMRLNSLEGSGKNARVDGYFVGGKTGTAEKIGQNGRYKRKALISSYVAAFPMHNPQYVVYVVLDEPKGTKKTFGYATGGWVAAPVVKETISQIGPMLGIKPIFSTHAAVEQQLALKWVKGHE